VVIPVYNGERYLAEAVESVLAQTYRPVEVVVVDDGSTDGSAAVAGRFGGVVRCVGQANAGPAAAMNRGVEEARGECLSFLSADDVWLPDKLALQVAALRDAERPDLVFGHMIHFLSPELDPERAASLHCPPEPVPGYAAGTLLLARETFLRVGPFDPRWRVGEFLDWRGRAADLALRETLLPQVVSRRRVHGENHSLRAATARTGYAHVLKAALDRRRQARP
jgi:glycosyltransferase involved in cell wall biosynthesis